MSGDVDVLVTLPRSIQEDLVGPAERSRLESLGSVRWNERDDQLDAGELATRLSGVDVCVTGWGTTPLDGDVIAGADELGLVAHVGGSVATVASDALYDRGISVTSANETMAPFVAEGILTYALATLRDVPAIDREMAAGGWPDDHDRVDTLYGAEVGFVGLGAVGRSLLALLAPFDVTVRVYDPYVDPEALDGVDAALVDDLDSVLEASDVVSIHAALTPETVHLLDADGLAALPDGCVLVNAARGLVVDEAALAAELDSGRIRAALDVYGEEPLPADSPFRALDDVLLAPHVAGAPARTRLASTVVEEVERFADGDPLEHEVPRERYARMTRSDLDRDDATG